MMRCALEDSAKSLGAREGEHARAIPSQWTLGFPKDMGASWISSRVFFSGSQGRLDGLDRGNAHCISQLEVQMRRQQGLQSLWFLGRGVFTVFPPHQFTTMEGS